MQYHDILYSIENHVATIVLNRPEKLNAWTETMDREVRSALEAAEDDSQVRAIVITGAGRGFCAGADMSLLNDAASGQRKAGQPDRVSDSAQDSIDLNYEQRFSHLLRLTKPVIAAINGPVAGIGFCLTLFCDLRYMASGAKLTTAFARRGLVAEHGVAWMLPRLIGTMNALDLLYSARAVQAEEAQGMGLVRTLPAEGFLDAVQATAAELVTLSSPRSIGVMKRQVFDSLFQSLAQSCAVADREMEASFSSEDFKEGVAHFVEKRAPAFTGR